MVCPVRSRRRTKTRIGITWIVVLTISNDTSGPGAPIEPDSQIDIAMLAGTVITAQVATKRAPTGSTTLIESG
jgi:hypothetical protein